MHFRSSGEQLYEVVLTSQGCFHDTPLLTSKKNTDVIKQNEKECTT